MSAKNLILRLMMFCLCLGGVIFMMTNLKKQGLNPEVLSSLGLIPQSTADRANQNIPKKAERFTWCKEPVVKINSADEGQSPLEFNGVRWLKNGQEIDLVAVEQWLLAHCRVRVQEWDIKDQGMPIWTEAIHVKFQDGSEGSIFQYRDWYSWQGKTFKSTQLTKALESLKNLEKHTN